MKNITLLGISILLFISCDSNSSTSSSIENLTSYQQLAILDGINSDTTNIEVIRIKVLLNKLAIGYQEPIDTIADWTSKAHGVLHDQGIKETNLNILEEMNKVGVIENTKYKDAITLYTMLRANR